MVKLAYDPKMESPKGPCVVVIHANWCGHCKTLMPIFKKEIVTSNEFSPELEGLLTLGSIEETEYNNHEKKEVFGTVDGYPIIRYIRFSNEGQPERSFDLPSDTPRDPENIIEWINSQVKNDVVKNGGGGGGYSKKRMNGGGKRKKYKTIRKTYKKNKNKTKKRMNKEYKHK
jgi:thiol-disulfide isomerase/thioredoxin